MFRKYSRAENIKTQSKVKSSEQRGIRAAILDQYPLLEPHIEDILPKKGDTIVCKCKDYVQLVVGPPPENEFIFFQCRNGPFIPTLRLLHKCAPPPHALPRGPRAGVPPSPAQASPRVVPADPDILPKFQVDRGAIRFVLSGANIMAPGLTSAGGSMDDVPSDTPVGVFAQGKEHALAIGMTMASTAEIRAENKGNAVENTHWLNDGLWCMRTADA